MQDTLSIRYIISLNNIYVRDVQFEYVQRRDVTTAHGVCLLNE